ncbi:MAG TPA: ABC transporter permease [Oligoflexia bacterium]|nr:ABC transporter permease [Oligoflexia bacterium]HMP47502.1 ABC transporter permease [Oligoflexia bacterium]
MTISKNSQLFWVLIFIVSLCFVMSFIRPGFLAYDNLHNISRNSSFVAIMALGQSWVILTGGIDLSVGSVMGLSAITAGLLLSGGYSIYFSIVAALLVAMTCGLINGVLISRFRLSPFIVTLGMLSITRSLCLVVSGNSMIYSFGPDEETFLLLGSEKILGLSLSTWIAIFLALLSLFVLRNLVIGVYLYAIGSNESACKAAGVSILSVKTTAYVVSATAAGISGVLTVAWLGSATTGLGTGDELTVIAATVLSGFSLSGGVGVAWAPVVGAFLIELVRNSLLLLGVPSFWQGMVVGIVLLGAIGVERLFNREKA